MPKLIAHRPPILMFLVALVISGGVALSPDHTNAQSVAFSPAGCFVNAQKAHPSSHVRHTVNHIGSLSCNYSVNFRTEVLGERSSWSGWRSHAPKKHFPSNWPSDGSWALGTGLTDNSGANCLDGTYDYRSRFRASSLEGGRIYSGAHTGPVGKVKRIADSSWPYYRCAWA